MPNAPVPPDINANWLKIARAMEATIRRAPGLGFAVMHVAILVDADARPRFWTEPHLTRIEPAKSDEILHVLIAMHGANK